MRRNLALLALCMVLPVGLASCGLSTDVDPEITFASQRTEWSASLAAFASVSAGPRIMLVSGLMLTPSMCFSLRANQQVRSGTITVTITGTSATNQCDPGLGAYSYQFLTSGIDSGIYQVRIIHLISGGASQTITDEEIEIG